MQLKSCHDFIIQDFDRALEVPKQLCGCKCVSHTFHEEGHRSTVACGACLLAHLGLSTQMFFVHPYKTMCVSAFFLRLIVFSANFDLLSQLRC